MKSILTLLLSLSITITAFGQNNRIDNGKNKMPESTDSLIIGNDTIHINGQELVEVLKDSNYRYLTTLSGDTIVKCEDYYNNIEFIDIDSDGYKDIRVFILGNTPNQCDNYLFDPHKKKYILIQGCDLDITQIKGTKLFYTYNHAGCADQDWESHLCKIENWEEVDIGHMYARGCGDENDGIKIYQVTNQTNVQNEKLIKAMPIPRFDNNSGIDKWTFIKQYWEMNYKLFE